MCDCRLVASFPGISRKRYPLVTTRTSLAAHRLTVFFPLSASTHAKQTLPILHGPREALVAAGYKITEYQTSSARLGCGLGMLTEDVDQAGRDAQQLRTSARS
jgi:hypothetical protein